MFPMYCSYSNNLCLWGLHMNTFVNACLHVSIGCLHVPILACIHACGVHTRGQESWWRNQIEIFSALLTLCKANHPVTRSRQFHSLFNPLFRHTSKKTSSLDVFFDVRLNKGLKKHRNCRWCETQWSSCDVTVVYLADLRNLSVKSNN